MAEEAPARRREQKCWEPKDAEAPSYRIGWGVARITLARDPRRATLRAVMNSLHWRRLCIAGLLACLAFGWTLQGSGSAMTAAGMSMPAHSGGCDDEPADRLDCPLGSCVTCPMVLPVALIVPTVEGVVAAVQADEQGSTFVPQTPTPPPRRLLRI